MLSTPKLIPRFWHDIELVAPDGTVLSKDRVLNLVPTEGMTLIGNILFKGAAVPAAWYIGLFESNYTPAAGLTAANLGATLTECVSYSEVTRPAFVPGTVVGGAVDNVLSRAEFTFTAAKTVYGGFISSSSVKGGAGGAIISVARYATAKSVDVGTILRVATGFSLVPA